MRIRVNDTGFYQPGELYDPGSCELPSRLELVMDNSEQRITTETALELLISQQRRRILRRVAETPDGTTVDRLTQQPRGSDPPQPDGSNASRHRRVELHHVHLPKLQAANVIAYDADRGTVHRDRAFQDVLSLLELIADHRADTATNSS